MSGRGVGLDVVLKSIERLNGLVEVETVPGVGTKFIIQLPLTLAIISALLVDVDGRTYAVPSGLGGGEPQVRSRRGAPHQRPRDAAHPRPHRAPGAARPTLFGLTAAPAADGDATR